MTSDQISEQIAAIKRATAKANVSKEAATKFLTEAGIIKMLSQNDPVDDLNIQEKSISATTLKKNKPNKTANSIK
jgi:hypothetical protein